MFRSMACALALAGALGVACAGRTAAAVIDLSMASAVHSWDVASMLQGSSVGSTPLALPGAGTAGSPAAWSTREQTTYSFVQGPTSDRFAVAVEAWTLDLGTVQARTDFTFTTTHWTRFTLTAQADANLLPGSVGLSFDGVTASGGRPFPSMYTWVGDIPLAPDEFTRTGLIAPGTYTFTGTLSEGPFPPRFPFPPTHGLATFALELEAADPPVGIPLPPALLMGGLLAVSLRTLAARRPAAP